MVRDIPVTQTYETWLIWWFIWLIWMRHHSERALISSTIAWCLSRYEGPRCEGLHIAHHCAFICPTQSIIYHRGKMRIGVRHDSDIRDIVSVPVVLSLRGLTQDSYIGDSAFVCDMTQTYQTWLIWWFIWLIRMRHHSEMRAAGSLLNVPCHRWMSHVTYEGVMSRVVWIDRGAWYEGRGKLAQCVMSQMSDSCHIWVSRVTHEWVMTCMSESYFVYEGYGKPAHSCAAWLRHMGRDSYGLVSSNESCLIRMRPVAYE